MNDEKYTTRLSMVMPESDRAKLQALGVKLGMTESDVIRHYIRQHYAEHFGRKKPPKPVLRKMPKRT